MSDLSVTRDDGVVTLTLNPADADTGVALLQQHYRRTVETLLANWKEFA